MVSIAKDFPVQVPYERAIACRQALADCTIHGLDEGLAWLNAEDREPYMRPLAESGIFDDYRREIEQQIIASLMIRRTVILGASS